MTGLARLSLANRAVVALLSLVIIGAGLFSTGALKQELMPSLTLPQASVLAVWQGAAPASVERDVTRPVEDAVKGVEGVTGVSSTSSANVAQISAEWDYAEDADEMEAKIRAAVDGVTGLPDEVEPEIAAFDFDALPVVALAVSSDLSPADLSERLRTIAVPRINALDGVGEATVSGEEVREVVITTRADDLDRTGVQPTELQQLLEVHGSQIPAGDLDTGSQRVNVQVGKTLGSVEDVRGIQLQGTDGPVRLDEVADVTNDPVDSTAISRVDGEPAISLNVTKTTEANTVGVASDLRALLPELEQEIGSGTRFQTVFDQSPFIEQSIHDLAVEGGLGLVMAILVILVFLLSLRSTIITAISIPLSLLIAMTGLYVGGFSLNILTLGALTVAVGRVVDDSIVVIENIKRHLGLGEPFGPGLILGAVREVAGAVTASTITTVAVFLPIALVGGQVGELFRPFAVTVTIALLASLVVSLTIVPVLSMWFMRPSRKQQAAIDAEDAETRASSESRETPLQKGYLPVLRATLRHPVITLAVAAVVFVLTLGSTTLLKTDFLGDAGQNSLLVSQEMPSGTTLADTDAAAQKVEAVLAADPAVETYQTTVGGQGADVLTGGSGGSNTATMSITLVPDSDGQEVTDRLRAQLATLTDVGETEVGLADGGAGGSSELAVQVVATDEQAIAAGAEQVEQALAGVPGLTDVGSDLAEQQTIFSVDVDQSRAAELGMSQATIGQAVAQALDGQPLGEVVLDERTEQVVLRSRAPVEDKAALEALELPVTQQQTADVQERESDELTEIQEENADEQQADADAQLDEQAETLAEQRTELGDQLTELNDQLEEARNAPAPEAGLPGGAGAAPGGGVPGGGLPGGGLPEDLLPSDLPSDLADASPEELEQAAEDVAESLREAGEQAAEDQQRALEEQQRAAEEAAAAQAAAAAEQQAAAVEQLEESIDQLEEQIVALDEQTVELADQRTEAQTQQQEAEELQERTEGVPDLRGDPVQLREVATVNEEKAPATITRVDGSRTVTVTATSTGDDLGATTLAVTQAIDGLDLPDGVSAEIGGVSAEQDEAFGQLFLAMGVAIAIVYVVMVATFRSLLQPLILLVSVPFAATGAIGLSLLTDTALGIPSMIGLLMLIGIVVTNAIVLIDLVNHYRAEGASVDDAVIHGARLRLRPIIMTALATIMALVPMSLGLTGGGVFISKPLAIVVIGGLISSTVLTLVLVPVLYHVVEKIRDRGSRPRRDQDEDEEPGGTQLDELLT